MHTESPHLQVSGRQLVRALLVALAIAGILLVVAVLPAEYGIDPLGIGARLGLVHPIDDAQSATASVDAALKPSPLGPSSQYGAPPRSDRATFTLGPYEYLEYKYHLAEGAHMVFAWQSSAPVIHDFHGAPDANPEAEVSIDKQTRSRASGALTAPFAGMHGWYWENPGGGTIAVELASAGFFSHAVERRSNGERKTHAVTSALPDVTAPEVKP